MFLDKHMTQKGHKRFDHKNDIQGILGDTDKH